MKILIPRNKRQKLASKIAAASFIKQGILPRNIIFIDFDDCPMLVEQVGKKYLRNGKIKIFKNDLQSFTLLRFFGPEYLGFKDLALIIDPDVFAIKNPKLILNEINDAVSVACTFYDGKPRSEVMLVNCKKINWNFKNLLSDLFKLKIDYKDLINLDFDKSLKIKKIDKSFNSHDKVNSDTIFLHTTNRITQPWKEGILIDFERHISKKYLFKEKIKKIFGMKYDYNIFQNTYQRHPEKDVINKFKEFYYYAKKINFINENEINLSIRDNFFSKNFLDN